MKKSKDNLSLDCFSLQFQHHIVIWACLKMWAPNIFPLLSQYDSNGKRQEHSLPSRTKWTIDYIIRIIYATKKRLTKQLGIIPSTFLVPLLIQWKKTFVSIIVNKSTGKQANWSCIINLPVNWLTIIDTK